jgi:hypothetical protein
VPHLGSCWRQNDYLDALCGPWQPCMLYVQVWPSPENIICVRVLASIYRPIAPIHGFALFLKIKSGIIMVYPYPGAWCNECNSGIYLRLTTDRADGFRRLWPGRSNPHRSLPLSAAWRAERRRVRLADLIPRGVSRRLAWGWVSSVAQQNRDTEASPVSDDQGFQAILPCPLTPGARHGQHRSVLGERGRVGLRRPDRSSRGHLPICSKTAR